jgi:hypothetical protein
VLWHILCLTVAHGILFPFVKNYKSRIASQDLQVKYCKSRIASKELQKSLLDSLDIFFSRLNEWKKFQSCSTHSWKLQQLQLWNHECQRPYAMLKAPVPSITGVKQHWAQSVLGWVTAYKRVNHTKDWLALLLARCCIASWGIDLYAS